MPTIVEQYSIAADVEAIWEVVALHFGKIADYSPLLKKSEYSHNQIEGVGTTRQCWMKHGGFVKEQVIAWQPCQKLSFEMIDGNLPIAKGSTLSFELIAQEKHTLLKVLGSFRLKKMAWLSFLLRPVMRKMIKSYIQDIKNAVQLNRPKGDARVHDYIKE